MAGSATPRGPLTATGPRWAPRPWRDLWAIDQRPEIVALAQTVKGKLLLVAAFASIAALLGMSLPYVLLAAAFAYWPAARGGIALLGAAMALARSSDVWLNHLSAVLTQEGVTEAQARGPVLAWVAAYFAIAFGALVLVRRHPTSPLARHPVLCQLAVTALLAAAATLLPLQGWARIGIWSLLNVVVAYMWFFSYAVQDQRSRTPGPLGFQMGILHPFWRATVWNYSLVPFGKGAIFLRKHLAKDAQALAVTQLKALKLLVWALLLAVLNRLLVDGLERHLGVPTLAAIFAAFLQGDPFPLALSWAGLVWFSLGAALRLAIMGHKIVAVARLAGFRLPRNTWRPLEARTLADFWNRYYYYFKELLVEFFFYPTFMRVLRKHPRLRVFFATFMAAGVGNAIYHYLRDIDMATSMGWEQASVSYISYLFYCTVLATGIGISQARISAGRRPPDTATGIVWSVLCVWFFHTCLQVFNHETRDFPFTDRLLFLLSLFGVQP